MSNRTLTRKPPRFSANRMWRRDEIEALGTTCPLMTAADILSISRNTAYEHAKAKTFPVKVLKLGGRCRVVVEELLDLLYGVDERAEGER
ncbi:helix-turn-helix transcriptional regulator [Glycomyces dulcitolivorans]|uniref:helix-turn-helix transcriptional regulator n=1 Tax=Glycomyces dulcitolivorans TaxID=2200759 RepID=UPI0018E59D05|nr:helix-turn-helix domain-containing protein [Glycomyces dulcitolivorans]